MPLLAFDYFSFRYAIAAIIAFSLYGALILLAPLMPLRCCLMLIAYLMPRFRLPCYDVYY